MSYCSLGEMGLSLAQGLRMAMDAEGGEIQAQQAIERASSEIDGYLVSGGYEIPLFFVPPNIAYYCVDLAIYNFAVSIGMSDDKAAEELGEKAKIAREFLRLVGQRKLSIPTGGTDSSGAAGQTKGGAHRIAVRQSIRPLVTGDYFCGGI